MDERAAVEMGDSAINLPSDLLEETSAEHVGRWNRLISTTNWEKGRIISVWRQSLIDAGAPREAYSDEAWSRRVGQVSGPHAGRLRRVYERFGDEYEQYPGLYWSHFLAAVDWPDAEMWLEGAVESGWPVARMRSQQWEVTGAPEGRKPSDADLVVTEPDEDAQIAEDVVPETIAGSTSVVQGTDFFEATDGDPRAPGEGHDAAVFDALALPDDSMVDLGPLRPLGGDLPPMPDDVTEVFEAFKQVIFKHKLARWQEIAQRDLLTTLEVLKELAIAPEDR